MASVALLLLLAAAAAVADHGFLDVSHRGLTVIDVVNASLDATSLTVNLSWNAINSWGGRPFLDLRNVTVLDLSHNQLRGIDAAALGDVPDVRELNLSDNALVNLGGRPFRALLNLVHLDLSKNNLETLKGFYLGDLVKLQRLNLRDNKLVALEDSDLRGLAKLRWLDVSDNNIASAAAGAFRGLNGIDELVADHNANLGSLVIVGRRLQKVSLRRSGLTAVPASLTRSVRTLILRGNRLKGVRCGDLDSYPLLRELDLSENDIETIEDDALGRLEQLVVLRLSFNLKLRVVPPGLPSGLTSLELVGNHIESVAASDFQGLRHLRELNLSGNPLSELSAGSFRPLETLETLDLSANALAALHADVLEGLSRLQVLRLTGLRHLVRPASWLPFPVAPERLTFLDVSNSPVLAAQLLADTAALTAMRQLSELGMEGDGLATLRTDLSSLVGRLRRIHLRDNLLNCSESALAWFSTWTAPLEVDDAQCASPESLRGKALSSLRRGSSEVALKDPTKFNSTTPSLSTQPSPLIMTTPSTPHLGSSSEQVLYHTMVVAGNLTTLTPVSSATRNTAPPTQFSVSSNPSSATPKAVIDPIHPKDEKSQQSSYDGNKQISGEARSQSSMNLLTSTPALDKSSQVSQQETIKTSLRTMTVSPSTSTSLSNTVLLVSSPVILSTTTVLPSKQVPPSKVLPSTTVSSPAVPPSKTISSPAVPPSTTISSPAVPPSTTISSPAVPPSTAISSPAVPPSTTGSSSALPPATTVAPPAVHPSTTVASPAVQPSTTVVSPAAQPLTTVSSSAGTPLTAVSPSRAPPSRTVQPKTTLSSSTTLSLSSTNSVRTEAVTSTSPAVTSHESTSGTHISETTHAGIPPPSREALRAERPSSSTSSVLAMFGVGAVGSALVLLVLAAAQAAPRPRLDLSSFNNLRNETAEEYDDTRADLW